MPSDDILIDLQIRAAFQDDAIAALDQQVQDQQRRIDLLERRFRLVLDRMEAALAGDGPAAPEPPPPHY